MYSLKKLTTTYNISPFCSQNQSLSESKDGAGYLLVLSSEASRRGERPLCVTCVPYFDESLRMHLQCCQYDYEAY